MIARPPCRTRYGDLGAPSPDESAKRVHGSVRVTRSGITLTLTVRYRRFVVDRPSFADDDGRSSLLGERQLPGWEVPKHDTLRWRSVSKKSREP